MAVGAAAGLASLSSPTSHVPEDRPACLLADVRMPDFSGLDLQECLSAYGWTLPVIFITGHATVPLCTRAMRAGAVNFLQKPFDEKEVLDSIHQALELDVTNRRRKSRRQACERQVESLTPREYEVFLLVLDGLLNKQIASRLGMSEKTVKVHRARVMEKTGVDSVAGLCQIAYRSGMIAFPDS